ncbi:hypothetical protein C8Q76DRAFT_606243 [Earliella scabrosa]|nr:hypothetical protein C8Q76DRAFT_606243 [Earliella scabrosa]
MIMPFVPRPKEFLRILTECHALIGGVFALGFLLRRPGFTVKVLDLFTSDMWFQVLLEYLVYSPFISHHTIFEGIVHSPTAYRRQRCIRRCAHFVTGSGLHILIHESNTLSPCSPIARTWTTVLMNFVTETSFACAYPRLTLQRHGLLADLALDIMAGEDFNSMSFLILQRVRFAMDSTVWPEYRARRRNFRLPGIIPCLRDLYLCPDQGRYFGDPGSIMSFIDPLSLTSRAAHARSLPPYGRMVAWRLWSSCACDGGCAQTDKILVNGIVTMPMVLVPNPIFQRPSVPDDELVHFDKTFFPLPKRSRRRAVTI